MTRAGSRRGARVEPAWKQEQMMSYSVGGEGYRQCTLTLLDRRHELGLIALLGAVPGATVSRPMCFRQTVPVASSSPKAVNLTPSSLAASCLGVRDSATISSSFRKYNDGESCVLLGRKRYCVSSLGYTGKRKGHYQHTGHVLLPSKSQGDSGNMETRDLLWEPSVRYTPYTMRRKSREDQHMKNKIHITVWRDGKPQKKEVRQHTEDGTLGSWFKVTIPCGRKSDKTQLMKSVHSLCRVPFTAVDFHCDKHRIRFFVQDASIACALRDVSYKIYDAESQKIPVFVNPSDVPYSVLNRFTGEQMEQLKLALKKRYDVSQHALNLQKLHSDPDLLHRGIHMILNRRSCMTATLQIIQEDFPELLSLNLSNNKLFRLDSLFDVVEKAPQVKILNLSTNELRTVCELEKMKGLKLKELWLEGNPLRSTFTDSSAYVSAVLDCFPELSHLDGRKLPLSTVMDIEEPQLMKPCKESFKASEAIKNQVHQFLQEYYFIYDYGDRQDLHGVYHDQACFSLTIPFNPSDPDLSGMCGYCMENPKEFHLQRQMLKYTKQDIVNFLRTLPKTLHALSSFQVDMCFQTDTMLCFSVSGLFKEVEGTYQGCIRAFMRTFTATLDRRSSNLCMVNDQLLVRNPSPDEIQGAFDAPLPTSCSAFKPVLSQEQQKMVWAFSTQSGMKLEWSQKCLEDNAWDYSRAAEVFTMLQVRSGNQVGDRWVSLEPLVRWSLGD
ncbi:nuclear RNA export factor 2-like [Phodopus roborovskii]|uniref:nuclear RNA export factor 2-like n=1 Tax=Phodopus roborovskii TaxID=109678 RepID=UPI0021E494B4|nr:nuclear RNA export factor 2-like [Phodopus roborovskii]